jgi:hypothetical protein
MADQNQKLDVSPRVIDSGSTVIQVTHVTSAGYGTGHPFRPVGILLILIGLGLTAAAVVGQGSAAFTLKSGGSPLLWVAFAAAGIGLFLAVFARRFLFIRTVDGARTKLAAGDEAASAMVIGRIREAMEAGGASAGAPAALGHGLPRNSLEEGASLPAGHAGEPLGLPHTGPPRGLPAAQPQNRGLIAADPRTGPGAGSGRRPDGYVNGHGGHASHGGAGGFGEATHAGDAGMARRQLTDYAPPRTIPDRAHHAAGAGQHAGALGTAGATLEQRLQAQVSTTAAMAMPPPREDPVHDLVQLMEHVRRSDVQHKEALLDLLRVVEDHYRGRASREDAIAHWRSFADYVVQYLGNVDGLIGLTERFGRHMVAR